MTEAWNPATELAALFATSAALGAVLGLEREIARKPAGLRTHILVSVASTLFVLLGLDLVDEFRDQVGGSVRSDPIRVIQAIVIGVSFLGAGTIMRDRDDGRVEGLTTAASILVTAAVGIAVALDRAALAAGVALGLAATIFVLGRLEERWSRTRSDRNARDPRTARD